MDLDLKMDLQHLLTDASGLWAVAAAIAGAALTQTFGSLRNRSRRRKDAELTFVESQIRDLYGPLYALSRANQHTYDKFKAANEEVIHALASGVTLSGEAAKTWKLWTDNVFQPGNRRIMDVILRGAHLFRTAEMPEIVLQFVAHVESYEALISTFEETGLSIPNQIIPFPEGFAEYVADEYKKVAQRYERLGAERKK